MPIYAYKCESCGHAKDVLQKISDEPLSVCPACGQSSFRKQVTAAGFQLKGSGWYVTDFREGNKSTSSTSPATGGATGSADKPAAETASSAPAPAAAAPAASTAPPAAT